MTTRIGDSIRLLFVATVLIGAVAGGTGVTAAENASVSFVTEDGKVTVQPAENQTIRATSDLEPGTNVSLRVESAGDTEPRFLKVTETTVGEDGNFSAAFNFSEAPDGGTFTVTATNNSGTFAEADGVVKSTEKDGIGIMVPGFGIGTAVFALAAVGAVAFLAGRRA